MLPSVVRTITTSCYIVCDILGIPSNSGIVHASYCDVWTKRLRENRRVPSATTSARICHRQKLAERVRGEAWWLEDAMVHGLATESFVI